MIPPELSEEERASILAAPEFIDFVEQSSKIVQRALNDGYDYIRDYTVNAESGGYAFKLTVVIHSSPNNSSGMIQKASASNVYANFGMNATERIDQSRILTGLQK